MGATFETEVGVLSVTWQYERKQWRLPWAIWRQVLIAKFIWSDTTCCVRSILRRNHRLHAIRRRTLRLVLFRGESVPLTARLIQASDCASTPPILCEPPPHLRYPVARTPFVPSRLTPRYPHWQSPETDRASTLHDKTLRHLSELLHPSHVR